MGCRGRGGTGTPGNRAFCSLCVPKRGGLAPGSALGTGASGCWGGGWGEGWGEGWGQAGGLATDACLARVRRTTTSAPCAGMAGSSSAATAAPGPSTWPACPRRSGTFPGEPLPPADRGGRLPEVLPSHGGRGWGPPGREASLQVTGDVGPGCGWPGWQGPRGQRSRMRVPSEGPSCAVAAHPQPKLPRAAGPHLQTRPYLARLLALALPLLPE